MDIKILKRRLHDQKVRFFSAYDRIASEAVKERDFRFCTFDARLHPHGGYP